MPYTKYMLCSVINNTPFHLMVCMVVSESVFTTEEPYHTTQYAYFIHYDQRAPHGATADYEMHLVPLQRLDFTAPF